MKVLQTSRAFFSRADENIRKFKKVAFPADHFGRADLCGSRHATTPDECVMVSLTTMQHRAAGQRFQIAVISGKCASWDRTHGVTGQLSIWKTSVSRSAR